MNAFVECVTEGATTGKRMTLSFTEPPSARMLNRRMEEVRRDRLERAKAEIATRISCVCGHMSAEQFDELVTHMAELQIKYTLRRSRDLFPEPDEPREHH